ncbi:dihydrofolate reductase family protein [Nocardia abscessus]|uniref:dihydrofolate reductase family protein n=1 Tax=Nocardia abscessus TaxID=120957 RepID=UPI001893E785|nr:dihydrofolate reductase family protein [Nocardia abscessus]MBF6220744.1 dihydrofolate reductase family protein [Nocardia abscessus]
MSRTRVHNFSISLDGFATGEGCSLDAPFGHAGDRLHHWMFAAPFGRELLSESAGSPSPASHAYAGGVGVDDAFARRYVVGVGAEIMGAGKFGPPGWHEDSDWQGWWGPNPPFHTPVFVLTHHPRPALEMEGGTTFHFVDASPTEALELARVAADDLDVRIGGGATMLRDFLSAGLIDHMHVVQVPVLLGRGVRFWDGLEDLQNSYHVEMVSSPSGVTHLTFNRA